MSFMRRSRPILIITALAVVSAAIWAAIYRAWVMVVGG